MMYKKSVPTLNHRRKRTAGALALIMMTAISMGNRTAFAAEPDVRAMPSESHALLEALRASQELHKQPALPAFPKFPIQERDWGKAFYDSHPVLRHPPGGNAGRAGLKLLETYSPEQLKAMAPAQIAGPHVPCPHCKTEKKKGPWDWTADLPNQITCKSCKTVYPNTQYPMDQERIYLSPFGEKITIHFYKDAEGMEYFFNSACNRKKERFLQGALRNLAYAYHDTGNEKAAEAAVAILEGYAESVPHWLTWGDRYNQKDHVRGYLSSGGPYMKDGKRDYETTVYCKEPMPYFWHESRCSTVYWFQSIPRMYYFYDLIYKSKHFENKRSPDGKTSYRFWIENSIFDNQAEYVLSFPWHAQVFNNLPCQVASLLNLAMICGRPEYAQFVRNYDQVVFRLYDCNHDIATIEGPGYHHTWMSVPREAYQKFPRYSDPEGYRDENGFVLKNEDLREGINKRRQFWSVSMMHFPDGTVYNIGDSGRKGGGALPRPLKESVNRIAPGFGLTILGDGTQIESNQVQAALSSNGGMHSHSHEDVNNLIVFGHGRELFSDISDGRPSRMTSGHNTVSIDEKNCGAGIAEGGFLELYTPNLPRLAVVRVEGERAAYKENCDRYRRTLIHNTVDLEHPYVLDIFEVKGGKKHEYFLQGSADQPYPQVGSCSLPLGPFEKPGSYEPDDILSWAGYTNLKATKMTEAGHVDFRFRDNLGLGTRTHFQKDSEMQLILGEMPNFRFRTSRGYLPTKRKDMLTGETIPKLILRHEGDNGLETRYVLVHEVLNGTSVVKEVRHQVNAEGVLAVEVDLGDRKDYYAMALEAPETLTSGPLQAQGLFAAAVTQNGKSDLWMAGATKATCQGRSLSNKNPVYTGTIQKVVRRETGAPKDAYLTDIQLPAGDALKYEMVMLEFFDKDGGHLFNLSSEIDEVVADGKQSWVTIEQDAGVLRNPDGTWKELFYPHRKAASCRLKIITSTTTVPQATLTPNNGRYNHFEVNDFIAVRAGEILKIKTANTSAPLQISGDVSASGRGQVDVALKGDVNLTIKASNPDGVVVPAVKRVRFVSPLKAQPVDTAALKPGIQWAHYAGRTDMKELAALRRLSAGLAEAVTDSKYVSGGQSIVFDGYLKITQPGRYTFYTRTGGGSRLILDGVEVMDTSRFRDHEEFSGDIYLEEGFHQLHVEFANDRNVGDFHIKMAGPGIKKGYLPTNRLFHKP